MRTVNRSELHVMNTSLTTATNPQTSQLITTSAPAIEQPSAWMRDGYSPTEIILAAAILTSLLMGGVTTVIMAMTGLVNTVATKAGNQTKQKTK